MSNIIFIQWTCAALEEARRIVSILVEKKLVACATLIPHVESIYRWKGKIEHDTEVKVILKTRLEHFYTIQELICAECSYDLPEIIYFNIDGGHQKYLDWLLECI